MWRRTTTTWIFVSNSATGPRFSRSDADPAVQYLRLAKDPRPRITESNETREAGQRLQRLPV